MRCSPALRKAEPLVSPRSHDEVLRFFDGFDLVEPGVVLIHDRRPDVVNDAAPEGIYGVVGIKP